MKSIHVTFTDAEFKKLKRVKGKYVSWHDYLMLKAYYIAKYKRNK